jgi:hypothetical protein
LDADFAGQSDRHSISGSVFLYSGGIISWLSRKQPLVALSLTKAEYILASDACQELKWLCGLINELTSNSLDTTQVLFCDNQSAIKLARNGLFSARTKHIDVRYYYIWEEIEHGSVDLKYCNTNKIAANLFTKALGSRKLKYFKFMIGLHPL